MGLLTIGMSWLVLGINKGDIGVEEANDIVSKMSLKAFNGGYKVMIIWMAEKDEFDVCAIQATEAH